MEGLGKQGEGFSKGNIGQIAKLLSEEGLGGSYGVFAPKEIIGEKGEKPLALFSQ